MLSFVAKLLLTLTAIAPVVLVMAMMAWLERELRVSLMLGASGVVLASGGFLLFAYASRQLERFPISPTSAEPADRENMAILIVYLTPLLRLSLSDFSWPIWTATVGIIVSLLSFSNSYPVNPILSLLKWHSFKVSTKEGITYTLVTKEKPKNVNRSFTVVQLTDYILVDVGG